MVENENVAQNKTLCSTAVGLVSSLADPTGRNSALPLQLSFI